MTVPGTSTMDNPLRVNVHVTGESDQGKTHFLLMLAKAIGGPIYALDIAGKGGILAVATHLGIDVTLHQTDDVDEALAIVTELRKNPQGYVNLLTDPVGYIWHLQQVWYATKKAAAEAGDADLIDIEPYKLRPARRKFHQLLATAVQCDMNFLCSSHLKPDWTWTSGGLAIKKEKDGTDKMVIDSEPRAEDHFDITLRLQMRPDENGVLTHMARREKDRYNIFPRGEWFAADHMRIVSELGEQLSRPSKAVEMVSEEEQARIQALADRMVELGAKGVDKQLSKSVKDAGAVSVAALTADAASGIVERLEAGVVKLEGAK